MPRKAKSQRVAAPQDQGYGQRGEQMAAQRAIPLPDNRSNQTVTPISAAPSAPQGAGGLAAALQAAQMTAPPTGGLDAPTQRPDEPITAGLSSGPGPGPTPMMAPVSETNQLVETLRAAYAIMPTPGVMALLEQALSRGQ